MATSSSVPTTRSILEIALGFLGALLILPVLFASIKLAFRAVFGVFKLRTTQKLVGEAVFVGLTTLLTKSDILDKLFGQKGEVGDGLLKPTPRN